MIVKKKPVATVRKNRTVAKKRLMVAPRSPSIETLMKRLQISHEKAKEIKFLMSHVGSDQDISRVMREIDKVLDGFGVESNRVNDTYSHYWQDIGLLFVNMGDSYVQTILYDVAKNRFECWTWGDWVESNERRVL